MIRDEHHPEHTTRPGPHAPLPGTGHPPRGLFVGRNGTLLEGAPGRAGLPRLECAEETLRQLFRASQRGWSIYLVGNEDSVACGKVSDAAWQSFEAGLLELLRRQGIPLARHYACLHHPRGKGSHRRDSVFRFPNTGALYHAAQEDGIELRESWVLSADADELAAGWRAECRTVHVAPPGRTASGLAVETDLRTGSLAAALRSVLADDEYARP